MPTNRRKRDRTKRYQITPEAIAAWKACDYHPLHRALGLMPWDLSPLPREITPLGVSEDMPLNQFDPHGSDKKMLALQRQLLSVGGWPDCRAAYEENLHEAEEDAAKARDCYLNPPQGEYGWGTKPEERRQRMLDAEDEVEYRKELLAGLTRVQRKWTRRVKA
jgi:hypothetical protein